MVIPCSIETLIYVIFVYTVVSRWQQRKHQLWIPAERRSQMTPHFFRMLKITSMSLFMLPWMNTKPASKRPYQRFVSDTSNPLPIFKFTLFTITYKLQMFGMSKVVAERNAAENKGIESSLPLRTVVSD